MDQSKDVLPIYDDAYQTFVNKYPKANRVNAHAYARMVVELSHADARMMVELSHADVRHQELKKKLDEIAHNVYYG